MRLEEWTAIFGPDDRDKSPSSASDEDDESKFWFSEPVDSPRLISEPAKPSQDTCISCLNGGSGICVDCAHCTKHCMCSAAEIEVILRTFICNPTTCMALACGQCSKCTDHCICKHEKMGNSPSTIIADVPKATLGNKFS